MLARKQKPRKSRCFTDSRQELNINLGYPLLDAGTEYVAPIADVVWAAHEGDRYRAQQVGYRHLAGPHDHFHEQVWQHDMRADSDGRVSVAVLNARLGLGFELNVAKDEFPCMYEWQNFQSGQYAFGIEPSTHHVMGAQFARERSEQILLSHGDAFSYQSEFRVLSGADAINASRLRISRTAEQPTDPYPSPSRNFVSLRAKRNLADRQSIEV